MAAAAPSRNPRAIEPQLMRLIEHGLCRRPAVARITSLAGSGDVADLLRFDVEAADAVRAKFANIKRAVRPEFDSKRLYKVGLERRPAVAAVSRFAGAGDGFYETGLRLDARVIIKASKHKP